MKIIEENEAKARKSLEEIESKMPRAIGTYVDGLQGNASIQLDNKNVQIFVDEEIHLKSMSQMYDPLYGFWPTENTMPNGEIVSWEAFGHQLSTEGSDLNFNKSGRTTGFTKDWSGALVFDEGGNAWGLVHGLFNDQTRNMFFCLASPLCLTLKALEQKSEKKELKLCRTTRRCAARLKKL